MRALGFLVAFAVGFVLWGVALALSGGVAPLGKTGNSEVVVFFIPVVAFAFPIAMVAFTREYMLSGTWVLALAPGLGFLNFAYASALLPEGPGAWDAPLTGTHLLILAGGWLLLLGLVLASMRSANKSEANRSGRPRA